MDYVVIGTAGHIDHGKTSLIKCLTETQLKGRKSNLDRLPEEQEREMTIDIGFSYLNLPSGRCAEIIDVPGHERFVKNMLAGASTVDVVLLVIDANEGIMPQTQEHFNILKLLGIKKGIIALTKIDLVDDIQLQLVVDDIKELVRGSFMEDAPIINTSVVKHSGLEQLIQTIDHEARNIALKDITLPVRIPIDRVFTVSGFGTVITGTLISGVLKVDDTIEVLPEYLSARVRQIESHGQKVREAKAGQRVGISLSGIKGADLMRGDCIVTPGYLVSSNLFDARLNLLPTSLSPIRNNMRLRLHLSTAEVLGRIKLLDKELINPGETGLVQFKSESQLPLTKADRFIIRFYTPRITVGGGFVIDPLPSKHKRLESNIIDGLSQLEKANIPEMVEQILLNYPEGVISEESLAKRVGFSESSLKPIIDRFVSQGTIRRSSQGHFLMHRQKIAEFKNAIAGLLEDLHKSQPHRLNIPMQEFRSKAIPKMPNAYFLNHILDELTSEEKIQMSQNALRLTNHSVQFTKEQTRLKDGIEQIYLKSAFKSPSLNEIVQILGTDLDAIKQIIIALQELGCLIGLPDDIIFHHKTVEQAKEILREYFTRNKEIRISEFCKLLNTSRKYGVPMCEYFDSIGLTKRVGDVRILC